MAQRYQVAVSAMLLTFLAVSPCSVAQSPCPIIVYPGESIQAAIDAAPEGAVICLEAGEWEENLRIVRSVMLRGTEAGTTVIRGRLVGPVIRIEAVRPEEIWFEDITISGGLREDDKEVGSGITCSGLASLSLINCRISKNDGLGIDFSSPGPANLVVEQCRVEQNGLGGIYILAFGAGIVNAWISDSTVLGPTAPEVLGTGGVIIMNSVEATIIGCKVGWFGFGLSIVGGVEVTYEGAPSQGSPVVTVEDCTIMGNGTGVVASSARLTVAGCEVSGNSNSGMALWMWVDTTLIGNVIRENGGYGVEMMWYRLATRDQLWHSTLGFGGRIAGRANTITENGTGGWWPEKLAFLTTEAGGELNDLWHVSSRVDLGRGPIMSLAYAPDGETLVVGSVSGIEVRDAVTLELRERFSDPNTVVRCPVFSPDGRFLAFISGAAETGEVWVRELDSDSHVRHWRFYGAPAVISFSPNGKMLLSVSDDLIWTELNLIGDLFKHSYRVSQVPHFAAVSISHDGRVVAFAAEAAEEVTLVLLWSAEENRVLHQLEGDVSPVKSFAFSPDDRVLASGSSKGEIGLWDTASGKCLHRLSGHAEAVLSLAFSPDGSLLASASMDMTIKLWDVESGREVRTLIGHGGSVNALVFSPDGLALASGSSDGTLRIWQLDEVLSPLMRGP